MILILSRTLLFVVALVTINISLMELVPQGMWLYLMGLGVGSVILGILMRDVCID